MTDANDDARAWALRLTATAVTVAGTLPYITLKLIWLTGGSAGIDDPVMLRDGGFFGLNLLTFGLDAVALLIALAFVRPWGFRIPAGLILAPMWVGIGLLVPLPLVVVPVFLADLFGGTPFVAGGGPVAGWVFAVVYAGFTCQAFGLVAGFVFHARRRWPGMFTRRTSEGAAGPTQELQVFVAGGAMIVALILAAFNLSWLLGFAVGLPAGALADRSLASWLQGAVSVLLPIAGAAGLLAIVRRRSGRPLWVPVTLAWIGSGGMFGWSMWMLLVTLTPTALKAAPGGGAMDLVTLFTLLTGLVTGLAGAFALVEREHENAG
ncbi:hypothetical protein ACQPYK_10405 [Streptosporangium sp. CA-135522]|uniref:hypothetical protein n=1 Tax=Streptosporangium sp. CA-135522 TaxID=3240072 RepID=UPI003D90372B